MTRKDTNKQFSSSPNSDISANSPQELLRTALDQATANCGFRSRADVEEHFGKPDVGQLSSKLRDKLKKMLVSEEASGFDTLDLRAAASAFALEKAIGVSYQQYDEIIREILRCFGGGTELMPPTDDCWIDAGEIGLGLSMLDCFHLPDKRQNAVTSAAARLDRRGYTLTLAKGRVDRTGSAISEITEAIRERLERLGLKNALASLLGTARHDSVHAFDQHLFGRAYVLVSSESSESAIPFGFLLNLVVRVSDEACTSTSPEADWREAVELARDLVAVIDVQPHNKFWMFNTKPRRIEELLNEVGLYDHLFAFRQWALPITPPMLQSFFGTEHDSALIAKHGWGVADAEALSEALARTSRKEEPQQFTRADLMSTGLDGCTLDRMLPYFLHKKGTVNACYDSPMAAGKADLMFRPLIECGNGAYCSPAASTIGPACYEAVATAMRKTLPSSEMSDLVGAGTERAVAALFHCAGIQPTVENLKYNESSATGAGECDLVLEDDSNILLIECKAKPLTRATMGGESFAAILDYTASVIASQVQALQHERLLRDNGEILFDNGRCLKHEGRKITRLSVTLLDHGSLQDHFLFVNLVVPLLHSKIVITQEEEKSRYDGLRKQFDRHRKEMKAAEIHEQSPQVKALEAASLSYGQLAIILGDNQTVSALVDVLRTPATFATMNPLLEYYHLKKSDLI